MESITYDRLAPGHHPDGSFVAWGHDPHGGESWGYRTWAGKVGKGHITIEQDADGDYVARERYAPGWRGWAGRSPDYCDHRAGSQGWCSGDHHAPGHGHAECEPPF